MSVLRRLLYHNCVIIVSYILTFVTVSRPCGMLVSHNTNRLVASRVTLILYTVSYIVNGHRLFSCCAMLILYKNYIGELQLYFYFTHYRLFLSFLFYV